MAELKIDSDVTILGAGMIAIEVAVALVERGHRVRIVGRGRPLRADFSDEPGRYISEILADHGIEIRTGRSISQVRKSGQGWRVICADGETFDASLVLSCLGVRPNLGIIDGTGIATDHGIIVSKTMQTNLDLIYAAGDVAEAPSFRNGLPGICAILPEAIAQGRVAGANMAGEERTYDGWIPVHVLRFFGESAFTAGAIAVDESCTEVRDRRDGHARQFARLVLSDGKISGATFLNFDVDPGVILYLIKKGVVVSPYLDAFLENPSLIGRWLMLKAEKTGSLETG